ncbi:MAG: hypothetical protein Q9163_006224 [Psora crenata]
MTRISNHRMGGNVIKLGHGTNVPDLVHADDGTGPADQEGGQGGDAEGEMLRILPFGPIEAPMAPEEDMFLQDDGDEHHDPVAHEGQEVLEDGEEVIAPRDGADKVDEHDKADPTPAGDHLAVPAQHLAAERRGVGAGDVVADDPQGDDDAAELAEPADGRVALQDQGARGDAVGVVPGRVGEGAAAETDADDVDKGEGGPEADEGHEEGEPLRGRLGVVDVKITAGTGPGDGDGQRQGEEGETVGRDGCRAADAAEDQQGDELGNPRISLVLVEDGHAEDGDEPADEGGNDDAHHDGHAAAGDGGEDLTGDDGGDGAVSDHDDHVEETGHLGGPIAHEISSDNLLEGKAPGGHHDAVDKAQMEQQGAQKADGQVVGRDVGAEPKNGHLGVAPEGYAMSFLGQHARDATSFQASQAFDSVVPFPEPAGNGYGRRELRDGSLLRIGTGGGGVEGGSMLLQIENHGAGWPL